MAEIPVEFPVKEPRLQPTINQFKELKKELRDAKGELAGLEQGTEQFARQAAKVGQINDKIKDLNASVSAVSGEPIENLTGSFGLLRNQVETLDFKGATSSLRSMSQVIGEIDINGLTSGLKAFGTELLNVGKAILTSPLFIIAATIGGIVYAITLLNEQEEKLAENQKTVNEFVESGTKLNKSYADSIFENTLRLRVLNKEITEVEAERLRIERKFGKDREAQSREAAQKIVDIVKNAGFQITDLTNINGQTVIKREILNSDLRIRKALAVEDAILEIKREAAKQGIQIQEALNKELDVINKTADAKRKVEVEKPKAVNWHTFLPPKDETEKELEDLKRYQSQYNGIIIDADAEKNEFLVISAQRTEKELDELRKKRLREEALTAQYEREIYTNTYTIAQGASDAFYLVKSLNLQKGTEEEIEAARQQFEINKALQLGAAVVNGAQSILAITSVPDFTLGVASAIRIGAQIALTASTIAKIASTQFQSPTSGGTSAPPTSSVSAPSTPSINNQPQQQRIFNPQAQGAGQGRNDIGGRVYVSEHDIRRTMQKVDVIERRATF